MSNESATRRYVALTTQGSGWWVEIAGQAGESRESVEQRAREKILADAGGDATDIYNNTWQKNLQVVSYSAAKRAFPRAMSAYDYDVEVGLR